MHHTTFQYLEPSERQKDRMQEIRNAAQTYMEAVMERVPPGDDKEHVIRLIRSSAMWANIAITRYADGTPRE